MERARPEGYDESAKGMGRKGERAKEVQAKVVIPPRFVPAGGPGCVPSKKARFWDPKASL